LDTSEGPVFAWAYRTENQLDPLEDYRKWHRLMYVVSRPHETVRSLSVGVEERRETSQNPIVVKEMRLRRSI